MIVCDIFDIEVDVENTNKRKLNWKFFTDLPCGTRVILYIQRLYTDFDDCECIWGLYNESFEVKRTDKGDFNGGYGELVVDNADASALKEFNNSLGAYSSGIKTPVSDNIIVSMVVGARQPLKAFGKNNINFSGQKVVGSGGINVVTVEHFVEVPIKSKFQPFDFNRK